jgi:hypothetical protein
LIQNDFRELKFIFDDKLLLNLLEHFPTDQFKPDQDHQHQHHQTLLQKHHQQRARYHLPNPLHIEVYFPVALDYRFLDLEAPLVVLDAELLAGELLEIAFQEGFEVAVADFGDGGILEYVVFRVVLGFGAAFLGNGRLFWVNYNRILT